MHEQGGINFAFLAEHFGSAQIWATECTRYSMRYNLQCMHSWLQLSCDLLHSKHM